MKRLALLEWALPHMEQSDGWFEIYAVWLLARPFAPRSAAAPHEAERVIARMRAIASSATSEATATARGHLRSRCIDPRAAERIGAASERREIGLHDAGRDDAGGDARLPASRDGGVRLSAKSSCALAIIRRRCPKSKAPSAGRVSMDTGDC